MSFLKAQPGPPVTSGTGRDRLMVPALTLFAFAIRAYMVATSDVITPDGILYIKIARLIDAGSWKAVYDDGFYSTFPFIVLVFQKVFHDWETAGRMASAVLGSLSVVPFYLLLRRAFGLKVAAVASLLFVLSPRLVQYSSDVLREPLFWCASLACLWAAWKGIEEKKWFFVALASLFAGLATFTRTEGLALVAIVVLWMGWAFLFRERRVRWLAVLLLTFLVAFPVIFVGPLYLLKCKIGHWELGQIGTKIPDLLSEESSAFRAAAAKRSLRFPDGGSFFDRVANNRFVSSVWEASYKYFRSFHVVMIFLLIFGVVRRRTIPYSGKEIPFLIWSGLYFLVALSYAFKVSYVSTRHGLLVGIPSLLWVAIGFWELSSRVEGLLGRTRWKERGVTRHAAVWLLILTCLSIVPKTLQSADRGKMELKTAGICLKDSGYAGEKFAVEPRINRVTFYKGGDFINIPVEIDYVALGKFLKTTDARFLVVDERTIEEAVKGFKNHTMELNLERVDIPPFRDYKEYTFAVYRIRK